LSDSCINCSTLNDFKSKIKVELGPTLWFQQLLIFDSSLEYLVYAWRKPVSTYAISAYLHFGGFSEVGELLVKVYAYLCKF